MVSIRSLHLNGSSAHQHTTLLDISKEVVHLFHVANVKDKVLLALTMFEMLNIKFVNFILLIL